MVAARTRSESLKKGIPYSTSKRAPVGFSRRALLAPRLPRKLENSKYYERTCQLVENKEEEFGEPVNLLKTSMLVWLSCQLVENTSDTCEEGDLESSEPVNLLKINCLPEPSCQVIEK